MIRWLKLALLGACAITPGLAAAETLRVSGIYPAGIDLPGEIDVLATDPFGGDAGPDVSLAVTDILGGVVIEGEPFFRIIPGGVFRHGAQHARFDRAGQEIGHDDPEAPDAVLRGSVHSEVIEEWASPRIISECIKRDEDGKCIKREEVSIPCSRLSVRLDPRIVLIAADGERLYSQGAPAIESVTYCRNDFDIPSAFEMANRLVDEIAYRVRSDLAPVERSRDYRIMERRKGLEGEDRDAFKAAIKLTKSSRGDACAAFQDIMHSNPDHLSVVFNVGLCAESFGYLDVAENLYRRALRIDPDHSYPADGLGRVQARQRAEAQLAARDEASAGYQGLR